MVALLEDLFIDPISNFAFCGIVKNAISQWKAVLRNVYENRTTQGFEGPDYKLHLASQKKHGVKQVKHILESPDSTVAMIKYEKRMDAWHAGKDPSQVKPLQLCEIMHSE